MTKLIKKTDASELKSIDFGQLVEDIHEHCQKEVVCFKIIMQCLVYALHAFPAYVLLKTPFGTQALNIFSSVVIDSNFII
jgi:hypothetical protein